MFRHFMIACFLLMTLGCSEPDLEFTMLDNPVVTTEPGVNIGTVTLLDGKMSGRLHGEDVGNETVSFTGLSHEDRGIVQLINYSDGQYHMARLTFNASLDSDVLMTSETIETHEETETGVLDNAIGCTGSAIGLWAKDSAANLVLARVRPLQEGLAELTFTLVFYNDEYLTGELIYKIN